MDKEKTTESMELDEAVNTDSRRTSIDGHSLVSVIVVNFNAGKLLRSAVQAVLNSEVPVEVLVSDNGSTDDSIALLEEFRGDPRLSVLENRRNLGFSRANNIALRQARGSYVLLLNPDCLVRPDTLPRMLAALDQYPDAAMAGCVIRNPDGTEQAGCRRRMPTPWRTLVRVLHLNALFPDNPRVRNIVLAHEPLPDQPVFLEAISGAFMFIRREALEEVGLLDEGYFMHCEDLDLCMRFQRMNRPILFVPDVDVVHYKGTCSFSRPLRVLWYKHRGMVRFYRKFFRHQYPHALMVLVIAAVWTRFSMLAGATLLKKVHSIGSRYQKPREYDPIPAGPASTSTTPPRTRSSMATSPTKDKRATEVRDGTRRATSEANRRAHALRKRIHAVVTKHPRH